MGDMRAFYRDARLPLTLAALGADRTSNATIETIAELSAAAAHMKKFDRPLTAKDIAEAIERVEAA